MHTVTDIYLQLYLLQDIDIERAWTYAVFRMLLFLADLDFFR